MKFRARSSRIVFLVAVCVTCVFFGTQVLSSDSLELYSYAHSKLPESTQVSKQVSNTVYALAYTLRESLAQTLSAEASLYGPKEGKVLAIQLDTKEVFLMLNGHIIDVFTLKGISEYQSPHAPEGGEFTVLQKSREHFSPLLQEWFPYTVSISHNMFLHADTGAVPHGTFVLEESDARSVYVFSDENTEVIITGEEVSPVVSERKFEYIINPEVAFPNINAESYLVADIETGNIILSREADTVRPIASITKLMTALVSSDTLNQYRLITLSPHAFTVPYAETGGLEPHEEISIRELMYPILLTSSNSAAHAVAEYAGYEQFITSMNTRAQEIGMSSTRFADPSGISSANISTAQDVYTLVRYLYQERRDILNMTRIPVKETLYHRWENNNKFVHLETYLGGKTGQTTAALQTLVSVFNIKLTEFENRPIVIVVMKSTQREQDVLALHDYLREAVYFATTRE